MSEPTVSSAARGWRGVMLEFFPTASADFTAVFQNHGITLYLNGRVDLHQRFEDKVAHSEMRPGNIVISPAGIPKTFCRSGDGDFLVVHIAPELLTSIADELNGACPHDVELVNRFCVRDARIESLTRLLWDEYRTRDLASGLCAESLGNQFAIHLLRHYSNVGKMGEVASSKLPAQSLKRAIDYVEANLDNDLTVTEIAGALSMSPGHFAHAFKSATGVAPHRYVMERRLELAKSLLSGTALPVATVAVRCGFTTQSHFCATFHKVVAQTPSAFRRQQMSLA